MQARPWLSRRRGRARANHPLAPAGGTHEHLLSEDAPAGVWHLSAKGRRSARRHRGGDCRGLSGLRYRPDVPKRGRDRRGPAGDRHRPRGSVHHHQGASRQFLRGQVRRLGRGEPQGAPGRSDRRAAAALAARRRRRGAVAAPARGLPQAGPCGQCRRVQLHRRHAARGCQGGRRADRDESGGVPPAAQSGQAASRGERGRNPALLLLLGGPRRDILAPRTSPRSAPPTARPQGRRRCAGSCKRA